MTGPQSLLVFHDLNTWDEYQSTVFCITSQFEFDIFSWWDQGYAFLTKTSRSDAVSLRAHCTKGTDTLHFWWCSSFFFFFFLAVLGLRCWACRLFSSRGEWGVLSSYGVLASRGSCSSFSGAWTLGGTGSGAAAPRHRLGSCGAQA